MYITSVTVRVRVFTDNTFDTWRRQFVCVFTIQQVLTLKNNRVSVLDNQQADGAT